jgi:hypothetical protein
LNIIQNDPFLKFETLNLGMNNSCRAVMQGINGDKQGDFGIWISDWEFNFREDQQDHPVSQMYRMAEIV